MRERERERDTVTKSTRKLHLKIASNICLLPLSDIIVSKQLDLNTEEVIVGIYFTIVFTVFLVSLSRCVVYDSVDLVLHSLCVKYFLRALVLPFLIVRNLDWFITMLRVGHQNVYHVPFV